MSDKRPAFQWYPKDYLTDERVVVMTLEEEAAYRRLMDFCWLHVSLPDDMNKMGAMCKTDGTHMAVLWDAISECFYKHEGRWFHPRLDLERKKQDAHREAKVRAGKRGAKARWEKEENGSAKVPPMAKDSPSSASASASAPSGKETADAQGRIFPETEVLEVGTIEPMKANELLKEWIDRQELPPDGKEKGRQAGKAKQICEKHSREDIIKAFNGMGQLFPHSDGTPWDLFDLDRKFSNAKQAILNHPEIQQMKRQREIEEELGI